MLSVASCWWSSWSWTFSWVNALSSVASPRNRSLVVLLYQVFPQQWTLSVHNTHTNTHQDGFAQSRDGSAQAGSAQNRDRFAQHRSATNDHYNPHDTAIVFVLDRRPLVVFGLGFPSIVFLGLVHPLSCRSRLSHQTNNWCVSYVAVVYSCTILTPHIHPVKAIFIQLVDCVLNHLLDLRAVPLGPSVNHASAFVRLVCSFNKNHFISFVSGSLAPYILKFVDLLIVIC